MQFEKRLARFLGVEDAVTYSSGFSVNLAEIYSPYQYREEEVTRVRIARFVDKCLHQPEGMLMLVFVGEEIAGYLLAGQRHNEITDARYPLIHALWVDKKWRAKNVSSLLMRETRQVFKDRGYHLLVAQVSETNGKMKRAMVRLFGFTPNSEFLTLSLVD
ncbi:GNAT family N-acetyltransferase [Paenibacillus popilliae]|uniref:7-keto-8-aminopelargonate synthetase n=1 Tax=Paenibacillus popilliae ATCC 14706 TaxID=1212764 RepID=M9M291_PAEPP|nr:GNAT family N-acetyltransferase [Paenibacillus popilliae]GAC41238.1 7-keto-8-aminopelargonate synthetase [Paenibacillus popilliae ATCC 14706]